MRIESRGRFFFVAFMLFFMSLSSYGRGRCEDVFTSSHDVFLNEPKNIDPFTTFPESTYGLSDSVRRGHAHFAKWAANLTAELLAQIQQRQIQPEMLFLLAMNARLEFAKNFENMPNPAEMGFGEPRVLWGRHEQSEERVGVSSIGLDLHTTDRPARDYIYPEPIWSRISKLSNRTEVADSIMQSIGKSQKFTREPPQRTLEVERIYDTFDGRKLVLAGTKITRLDNAGSDSAYLVSLLNTPKSNVEIIINDVHSRIRIVLESMENNEVNREHLIHAMQGYFCAMPYYRGSGAVGRVVFTALFSGLYRQQVTLHPEIDIKALSLEYEEFKKSFQLTPDMYPNKITGRLQSFPLYNKTRSILGAVKRFLWF